MSDFDHFRPGSPGAVVSKSIDELFGTLFLVLAVIAIIGAMA